MEAGRRSRLISRRLAGVADAPMERLNRDRLRIEAAGRPVLNLGQAVPDLRPPEQALRAVAADLGTGALDVYTPDAGIDELREAIATDLRDRYGVAAARPEEVLVTAGANHAFLLVCLSLLEESDRVGLLSPYFLNHPMTVAGCGGQPVPIHGGDGFDYPAAVIRRAIVDHDLRGVVVVNPSNPTGKVFSAAELRAVATTCAETGAWLAVDEVYRAFVAEPARMTSIGAVTSPADPVVTIGSFSKEFGMTGWRVGWLRAPEPLVREMIKMQDCSIICAPHPSQRLALACLEEAPDWAQSHRAEFARRRDGLLRPLVESGLFEVYDAAGAFFIWMRPHAEIDSEAVAADLMEHDGICVVPGATSGEAWRSWLRLSYGNQPAGVLESAAQRIVARFGRLSAA